MDLVAYCQTSKSAVDTANSSGLLEKIRIVEIDIKAGTAIDFSIRMFPEKAVVDHDPEKTTSGGWVTGMRGEDLMINNQRISVYSTLDWWNGSHGDRTVIEIDSLEAESLCGKIRSYA